MQYENTKILIDPIKDISALAPREAMALSNLSKLTVIVELLKTPGKEKRSLHDRKFTSGHDSDWCGPAFTY
jgi:hypothetical protein